MKTSKNIQRTFRQNSACGTSVKPTATLIIVLFVAILLGGISAQATDYYWITNVPDNYSDPAAWDQGAVPNDSSAVAYTTNDASIIYDVPMTNQLSLFQLGVLNDNPGGTFTMNGGALSITNTTQGGLSIGGSFGGSGGNGNGVGSTATFILNGGTVTVVRKQSTFYQDDVELASQTNTTGILTVNGGLLDNICNMQIGYYGNGILNINGGAVIEDSGLLNVCAGQAAEDASGTLNLNGGVL
jgi:T5SS/PEP-CTERM-associated repeat protein